MATQFQRQALSTLLVDIGDDNLRPLGDKRPHTCCTNARGTSADYCYPTFQ
ncbi:hypothetical protein D3C78_1711510 [compost metagenome]